MSNDPTVFDPGHGPLSSLDERRGGVAGAAIGGLAGYSAGGPRGALVGAAVGWAVGEGVDD